MEKTSIYLDVDLIAEIDAEVENHREETRSSFIRSAARAELARRKGERKA